MPFEKGQSGNPFGALPIGNDLKEARKITRQEFERIVNKYLYMTLDKIQESMTDPEVRKKTPVLDLVIISILHKALIEGDERRFNFILDRTIGQVVKKIHVVSEVENDAEAPIELTLEEKFEMLERYKKTLQKKSEVLDVSPVSREDQSQIQESNEK